MSWNLVEIQDTSYIYQITDENGQVKILFSNFVVLKEEFLSKEEVAERVQACNKNLEYNVDTALEILLKSPADSITFSEESTFSTIPLVVKFKYYIMKIPFQFSWCLTESSDSTNLAKAFTFPLIKLVFDLLTHKDDLNKTIAQKDQEITEYKAQGATLLTKYTTKTDQSSFLEDSSLNGLFTSEARTILTKLSDVFKDRPVLNRASVSDKEKIHVSPLHNKKKYLQRMQRRQFEAVQCELEYSNEDSPEARSSSISTSAPATHKVTQAEVQPKIKRIRRGFNF